MNRPSMRIILLMGLLLAFTGWFEQESAHAAPIGTAITYQGRLDDTGAPANGSYDFRFSIYDALTAGTQIGSTLTPTILVTDGIFNTTLDFGAGAFAGDARYLEIEVQFSGGGGYTTLTPRQPLSTVPHATYAGSVQPVANVVVVAKSGGDHATIGAALAAVTGTIGNPYLIRIGPGVYEETIDLEEYVDIEGSGEGITIVRGTGGANSPFVDGSSATVRSSGAISAELRMLTIESVATGGNAAAVWTKDGGPELRLTRITATASGGSNENFGVVNFTSSPTMTHVNAVASGGVSNFGVYNFSSSSPMMTHVTATGSGGTNSHGVVNYSNSNPVMKDVTANASGGANNYGLRNYAGSTPVIRDSTLTGSTNSATNDGTSSARISDTLLDGAVDIGGGLDCIGAYGDSFSPLNGSCLSAGDGLGPKGQIAWIGENRARNQAEIAINMMARFPELQITHETFDTAEADGGIAEYTALIQARYDLGVRRFLLGDFSSRLSGIIGFINGLSDAHFVSAYSNGIAGLNGADNLERMLPSIASFAAAAAVEIQKVASQAVVIHRTDSAFDTDYYNGMAAALGPAALTLALTSAELSGDPTPQIEAFLFGLSPIPDGIVIADSAYTENTIAALEAAEATVAHSFSTRWTIDSGSSIGSSTNSYRFTDVYVPNSDFVESVEALVPVYEPRERMYIEALRYLGYDRLVPEGLGIMGPLDLDAGGDRNRNYFYGVYDSATGSLEAVGFIE